MAFLKWPWPKPKEMADAQPGGQDQTDPYAGLQSHPRMHSVLLDPGRAIAIISNQRDALSSAGKWIRENGHPVMFLQSLSSVARQMFGGRSPFDLIIVDVDSLGDLDSLVDGLCDLRRRAPELAIILTSSKFAQDDFGPSRLAIADVSLRWPVNFTRLELAMSEAAINNETWQQRQGSLQQSAM